MLLPLDFVLLGGLNGCVILEPLHHLRRRPEVTGQDDRMALQSCLVFHLPGDLYVVICKAGLGKKTGPVWRRGKFLLCTLCQLIPCVSFTTVSWIVQMTLEFSVTELMCFEDKPTWCSTGNTGFCKIMLCISYQMCGPVLVQCLLSCSPRFLFKSKLKTKQGLQDAIGDIYSGDSKR